MNKYFNLENPMGSLIIFRGINYTEYHTILNILLRKTNMETQWPVLMFKNDSVEEEFYFSIMVQQGYLFLLFSEDKEGLLAQLEDILRKLTQTKSWNQKTKFIVLTSNMSNITSSEFVMNVCKVMWETGRIINIVVIVYAIENVLQENIFKPRNTDRTQTVLETYTWFPYQKGNCKEPTNIELINKFL